jgi:hypothetical protein
VKKRAASGTISDTKKKKEIERKVKTVPGTAEKTAEKKKRKIAPKTTEKTTARKVKAEGEKRVKKVKGKEKQKTIREKISPKPEKREKVKAEGQSEKKITKTRVPEKEKAGKVSRTARIVRKTEEKAPPERREKVPPKAAGKVRIRKKLAAKTAEKFKAGVVTKAETVEKEEKTPGQIVKKEVVSAGVKEVAVGIAIGESEKKEKPRRLVKGAGKAEGFRERVEAGQGEAGRVAEAKEVAGVQKAEAQEEVGEKEARPPTPWAVLPEEYGENSVTLMTVDPYRLFAFWEVREETLEIFRGEVDIRVYDVTDIDFDRMDANSCFDVRADARIGKCYISVNPEREYTADIGIIFDGIYIAIARSAKVSTPRATVSEEGILLSGLRETGLRPGY